MADEPSLLTDLADFYDALPFEYLLVGHCLLVASWFPKLKDRFLLSYWVRSLLANAIARKQQSALDLTLKLMCNKCARSHIQWCSWNSSVTKENGACPELMPSAGRLPRSICGWSSVSTAHSEPEGGAYSAADVQQCGHHLDSLLVAGQLLPRQPRRQGHVVAALPARCQGELLLILLLWQTMHQGQKCAGPHACMK